MATKKDPFDRARFYEIEGRQLPSVTTILDIISKPALVPWAVSMERRAFEWAILETLSDPKVKRDTVLAAVVDHLKSGRAHVKATDEAKVIGTAAHAMIEWRTRKLLGEKVGPEPEIPEAAQVAVMAWEDWAKEVEFTPIMAERTVYCLGCGYAGTLDWVAKVRGVVTLGDYKTSKAIYPESWLQNAAYRHAAARNGIETQQGIVLRLPKTLDDLGAEKVFEAFVVPEIPLSDFLAVLRVWRWKRRSEGKRVAESEESHA